MKRMNNTSFQGLENQKTLESFWHKEEEEEVQRDSEINVENIVCVMNELEKIEVQIDRCEMQNKVLLLQTLHVWSREPLEEL